MGILASIAISTTLGIGSLGIIVFVSIKIKSWAKSLDMSTAIVEN